ncbi:MAG: hypothetical protein WA842_01935 [Croceibacterium sp.]
MEFARKNGPNMIGVAFALVGLVKFLNGGNWVVWFILAIVFGVLGNRHVLSGGGSKGE